MAIPFATKTFTVVRKSVVVNAQGNPTPGGPKTIATGVAVVLRDLNANLLNDQTGTTEIGLYRGTTDVKANILVGDTLKDETENDSSGNPVQYRVLQSTILPIYLKLHLKRIQVGV